MPTVLITGIVGFVGGHLADLLLQDENVRLAGLIHPTHKPQYLQKSANVSFYTADILDEKSLTAAIDQIQPDIVYHLAGMAHVHESWKNRKESIHTNFLGAFNLLEALRQLSVFPKVLLVGSAECYGIVPEEEQPIRESRLFSPTSPYAVGKIAQEMLGAQCARAEKLPVYLSRSFNHTGPRQKESFVCSAFARQIALGENHSDSKVLRVGNLSPRRDFSDVRDVVKAYKTIIEKGRPGEPYNVCSGRALSIEEILSILLSYSDKRFEIVTEPEKFRPSDMPLLLGSNEKLVTETGWKPAYRIEETLRDLLDYWRSKMGRSLFVS